MAERPSQQQYDDLGAPIPGAPVKSSWFGSLTAVLNVVGTVLIIAMAIAVNADIIGRDLFNQPVAGVTEFLGLAIVAVVFLQMADTLRKGRHVSNDIILSWVGESRPRVSYFFYGVFHLIGAGLMFLIVWFVWPMFVEMYQQGYYKGTAGVAEIPIWPFVLAVILGGVASCVQYLLFALAELVRAFGPIPGWRAMSDIIIGAVCMLVSMLLIQTGMHIGVALMAVSFAGVFAMKGIDVSGKLLARSAATSIASDAYGVIPLFVLMGLFVSATNMGRDTFDVAALMLKRVRGGLAMATVGANAVFAACTGTSIASASIFTKIAVPEMIRYGHTTNFSVGVVAGSSVLGMLIPPSILFIIFGVIANVSIADLFTSGIVPGVLLSVAFCLTISLVAYRYERFVFVDPNMQHGAYRGPLEGKSGWYVAWKFVPICVLIGVVLGGIYGGLFTPTEAGGAGALAAFAIALLRRELTPKMFWQVALETGRVTAAICFLLMAAQLYTQMLTLSGLPYAVGQWLQSSGLSFVIILTGYLVVVLIMGCFLDSVSIMLILLPFVLPVMDTFHVNLIWFGLITVIAIEIGLLTPPLGVSVFVVKANLDDQSITTWQIFKGTAPMTLTMVAILLITVLFPSLSLVLLGQRWSWW